MTSPDADPAGGSERDDNALVLAIASRRDRSAFVVLFGRFAPRLKSWFIRTGTPAEQAEDLAQETMLAIWRKAATFDPARAAVTAWIFAIARNQRIDSIRRVRRSIPPVDYPSLVPLMDEVEPSQPDTAFAAQERQNRVRAALNNLPPEQAAVIQLSFFQDFPHAEIEVTLGIPLGTVKSRLRLAMNRLRAELGDHRPSPTDESLSGEPT